MKRFLAILVLALALVSCRTATLVPYEPNPLKVGDPVGVMKQVIQQQPPAYTTIPAGLEIDDQCIKLYMESLRPASLIPLYYKNIGRVWLAYIDRDKLWRVQIDDRSGNYMYWVYSYERSDAERFIDAISYFIKKAKEMYPA